ncbi:DUF1127 domain-containing protein [Amaricoccus sp.]|uniref:DUF1127 domain-containing protein n=1 Tax=Amaricoccus sp. TaxID=1872485 RepID=UPI00262F14FA|nr:DUF1127 domain-containing protein [uncultured Amaricoccus sp.]
MAHALTHASNGGFFNEAHGPFAGIAKAFADWMLYRRTLVELRALSARELADLGLAPTDLRAVAFESVYGA